MNNATNELPTESHILDEIPAYLTGGLNPAERKNFESHVAGCPECAAAMFDAKAMDDSLQSLFKNVSPDRGFENRIVARFRQKTHRPLHPMVRRAAIGVAATILLGSAGYFFQQNSQRLERLRSASNMKQIGLAMSMYGNAEKNNGAARMYYQDFHSYPAPLSEDLEVVTQDERVATEPKEAKVAATDADQGTGANTPNPEEPRLRKTLNSLNGQLDDLQLRLLPDHSDVKRVQRQIASVEEQLSQAREYEQGSSLTKAGSDRNFGGSDDVATDASGNADKQVGAAANKPAPGLNGPAPVAPMAVTSPTPSVTTSPPTDVDAASVTLKLPLGQLPGISYYGATRVTDGPPASAYTKEDAGKKIGAYNAAPSARDVNTSNATELAQLSSGHSLPEEQRHGEDANGESADKPAAAPAAPSAQQTAPDDKEAISRKIIREGEMTFEIDSFDSTVMNIGKIVAEEGGFVSTTDSDKLANGKVKGTVVVRVPPDHLDTLVLKLRGIGDLKSQKITAQDITKQYTDLESELRAAQAMQERLLEIIKNGKGPVKDLLEAEKQLGLWREKIEQVEGELRYDNNLVSLSTLSISLIERDIKSAAFSSINEQVTMALETEKVEEAYNATREAIDNAKGRIIQSELKQYDAGQFGATIRAQLPPDAADAVIGRIRQLDGRIANFQRERNQSNEEGSAAPLDASKVKREDVTLSLTIYNLANIAPRRTTTLTLAANSVEDAYAAILDQAAKAGARVVTSDLNRSRPDQSTGTITLSAPSEKADALLASVRGAGEMLGQENSDNPDTQNVTSAKRGLIVQLISVASVQARQSDTLQLAAADVPGAFATILDALRAADARIIASQLNQQDPANKSATIAFDISRIARPPIDSTIDKVGEIVARNITRSQDTANTLDSKIHVEMTLRSADVLPAREITTLGVEVPDVQKSVNDLVSAAGDLGGREIDKDISQDQNGRSLAHVIVEVPLDKADGLSERIESWGHRRAKEMTRNPQAPEGKLARGRLEVTLADAATSLGGQETTWDAIRNGLSVSGQGLRWSMQMIVVGICFVAPWVIAMWVGWRLFRRVKTRPATTTVSKPA